MKEDQKSNIEKAQRGDTVAFGDIYKYYMPVIYRYIAFRLNSKEDAEDLTEQIFFKVWQAIRKFNPRKASFTTWLFTIAKRSLIDFYRTHKVTYELKEAIGVSSAEKSFAEVIDTKIALDRVLPVVKSLPEEQEEIIVLRFLSQLTVREAAEAMRKTEGAVRTLQHRALKQLRKDLVNISI